MRDRQRRGRRQASLILLLGVSAALPLSLVATGAVTADPPPAPVITFDDPSSRSVEYGEQWYFTATATPTLMATGPWSGSATMHSAPSGYAAQVSSYQDAAYTTTYVYVNQSYDLAPLAPGSYTVDATVTNGTDSATTTAPARLTVVPAKLGVELRVLSDANNPDGAIVTARFTGRFVDEYGSSFYPGSALSPEGTWKISLIDTDGQVATERSIERRAGDDVLATSFYWQDPEPNAKYVAKATFTVSGTSAGNFDVAPAADFPFTSSDESRPVPTSTATAAAPAPLPEVSDFSLPLWALILGGVLIAGLAALVIVFLVKLRASANAAEDGAPDAAV